MKFIDEFRDPGLVESLRSHIHDLVRPGANYRLMEFCGGHTHAIHRHGLADLLPAEIELVHGPLAGLRAADLRLEQAIRLALDHEVILCSYGDMLRVPAVKRRSCFQLSGRGG